VGTDFTTKTILRGDGLSAYIWLSIFHNMFFDIANIRERCRVKTKPLLSLANYRGLQGWELGVLAYIPEHRLSAPKHFYYFLIGYRRLPWQFLYEIHISFLNYFRKLIS